MATLTQIDPLTDSVPAGSSDTYTNQLNVEGSVGAVTFETTVPSTAVLVYPDGAIATTGVLEVGVYLVSGTEADQDNNTGTWAFILTVTATLVSPEVIIAPLQAQPPTGIEILVPFQIDPATGGVAVLTSYVEILEQHIATIIMTALRERVMLPSYGYGLEKAVFDPIQVVVTGLIQDDILKAVQQWEPAVVVRGVTVQPSAAQPDVLTVSVSFSVVPFNDVNVVIVTAGGTLSQVIAP